MWVCNNCRTKERFSIRTEGTSHGKCEVCGNEAACYDC